MQITVQERQAIQAKTGTYMHNGEANLEANFGLRNMLGMAERVEANASMGNNTSNTMETVFKLPRLAGKDMQLQASVFKTSNNLVKHSSFMEKNRGLGASVLLGRPRSATGVTQLGWEACWRDNQFVLDTTSWRHLSEWGSTLKVALKHSSTLDFTDNVLVPSEGWAARISNEWAGLGGLLGGVHFFKQELQVR